MTEPVPRATSPRRTVRVAVALVTGQALLCAVIGWVTFGSPKQSPQAAGPAGAVAGPLAQSAPSLPLPVLPLLPTAAPTPARTTTATTTATTTRQARPTTSPPPAPAVPTPARTPSKRPVQTSTTEAPLLDPVPPNPDLMLTPFPPVPPTGAPGPVVAGTPCEAEGTPGLTDDDVKVTCVRKPDGSLVWQIN